MDYMIVHKNYGPCCDLPQMAIEEFGGSIRGGIVRFPSYMQASIFAGGMIALGIFNPEDIQVLAFDNKENKQLIMDGLSNEDFVEIKNAKRN